MAIQGEAFGVDFLVFAQERLEQRYSPSLKTLAERGYSGEMVETILDPEATAMEGELGPDEEITVVRVRLPVAADKVADIAVASPGSINLKLEEPIEGINETTVTNRNTKRNKVVTVAVPIGAAFVISAAAVGAYLRKGDNVRKRP